MPQLTRLKQLTRLTALGSGGSVRGLLPALLGEEYLTSDDGPYQTSSGRSLWVIPEWMAYATSDAGLCLTTDQGYYLTTGSFYVSNGILRAQ